MTRAWIPKNFEEACKRAAGRRRYLAQRQKAQWGRQIEVLGELQKSNWETYGLGRALARSLRVSEATISRDIRQLKEISDAAWYPFK